MISNIKANPINWVKKCYIASKINTDSQEFDDEGNEIDVYSTPVLYKFNYQPVSSNVDLMEFGERASIIQKAVIPIEYSGYFKENDIAYLDGTEPNDDEFESNIVYGNGANYRLLPPRNGNSVIIIYFEKITEGR